MYEKLLGAHIALVEAVNSKTLNTNEWSIAYNYLNGFREALRILGINQYVDCDMHYINQGIDRDMCCGVFLN